MSSTEPSIWFGLASTGILLSFIARAVQNGHVVVCAAQDWK
jgi:hypothetical protein